MNTANITRFLTSRVPVSHFLALTVFFTILLVVFGQPVDMLRHTSQLSSLHPLMQLSCTAAAGLGVVILSRLVLSIVGSRLSVSNLGLIIWLLAELIVCMATLLLTLWGVSGGGKFMLAPLAGDFLLGLFSVEVLPYVISYLVYRLHEEHSEVERLRASIPPDAVEGYVSPDSNVNFYDKGGRLSFATSRRSLLYIEAANNYTNIHYTNEGKEETFILHNTLKVLEAQLGGAGIVRCHRGYLVNLDNVKLMRKDGSGLLLELSGCAKSIPVTKTFTSSITQRLTSPAVES